MNKSPFFKLKTHLMEMQKRINELNLKPNNELNKIIKKEIMPDKNLNLNTKKDKARQYGFIYLKWGEDKLKDIKYNNLDELK